MRLVIPAVINDSKLVSSTIADNEIAEYATGVTYPILARVSKIGPETHEIYESLIDNNLNKPLTDTTAWIFVGKTNRWRMFDGSVSSESTATGEIKVVLQGLGNLSDVYIDNVFCQYIRVRLIDASFGVVYDKIQTVISDRGVDNWYDFFYSPYQAKTSILFSNLPYYANTQLEITLTTSGGGQVSVGAIIPGFGQLLGQTQYGLKMGIQDYSVKQRNDFGDVYILEREYSKYASFSVWVRVAEADYIQQLLAGVRATVCLYLSDNDGVNREASHIVGFYSDFYEVMTNNDYTEFTLEIEGLT